MTALFQGSPRARRRRPPARACGPLLAVSLLAGLLLVPGCAALVGGEPAPPRPERIEIDEDRLEGETAPPLSAVPSERPQVTPPEERAEIERQLREDRARAQAAMSAMPGGAARAPQLPGAPAEEGQASLGEPVSGGGQEPASGFFGPGSFPPDSPAARAAAGQTATTSADPLAAQVAATGSRMVGVIHFLHGSAGLDARDLDILRQIAALRRDTGGRLLLVGHASARSAPLDPQRHEEVNREMSDRRANAVADALLRAGVPADALLLEAVGARGRVYHEYMPTGEAGNRRVEIYLQS